MTKVLTVIGSARKGRVAEKINQHIHDAASTIEGIELTTADLQELALPFFDHEETPSSPTYAPTNEQVKKWSALVTEADAVLFITPEYNHTLSAIQKNAIDSLFTEWQDKPVSAVTYGWGGGTLSLGTFNEVMNHLKATIKEPVTSLSFMKDLNPDGSVLDSESVTTQLQATLKALQ